MKPPLAPRPPLKPCRLTGSRMFGVARHNSDWDWFSVFLPHRQEIAGWMPVNNYGPGDGFMIFRRGRENLIIAMRREAILSWEAAERHCMIERPRSKARRKAIFDHYLYGMPLHRNEPLPYQSRQMWHGRYDHGVYSRHRDILVDVSLAMNPGGSDE